MHLLIRLTLDGQQQNAILAPADGVLLVCTHAAATYIQAEVRKSGGQCKLCGILARSTELADGHCLSTIGCGGIDSTYADYVRSPDWAEPALIDLYGSHAVQQFIENSRFFLERVAPQLTQLDAPVQSADDYADLFDSFFGKGGD